jgi:ribosome biogenesis protein ENP2
LVQDLNFPTASQRVKLSADGRFLAASGTYAPSIKVFDLDQLGVKYSHHVDCDVVQMQFLSDDYSKMVLLEADRCVEVHQSSCKLHKLRVPKTPRDMTYHRPSCDLMVCGSSPDIWRLNLEQGRFLSSLTTSMPAVNVIKLSPALQLAAAGGTNGVVECWDPRARRHVASLDVGAVTPRGSTAASAVAATPAAAAAALSSCEVTALRFSTDGLRMLAGTSTGHALLFDVRSARPLQVKAHQYALPIVDVRFHDASRTYVTLDAKVAKFWSVETVRRRRRRLFRPALD